VEKFVKNSQMLDDPQAYQKFLLENAFADERGLLLRKRMHDLYSVPQMNIAEWVLDRFQWKGNEKVLDIGSGPGSYLEPLLTHIQPEQYVAGDLSLGMLKAVRQNDLPLKTSVMNVVQLPFPDETFDVVLANHMLSYVPDVDQAAAEIRRVLRRPHGVLIAATNSEYTMPEFNTLMQRAVRLLRRGAGDELIDLSALYNFSLESGSVVLARHFPAVARYDIPSMFVFHDAEPVTDYVESCRPFYEPQLPDGILWEEFMTIMADQIRRLVDHFGELMVNKLSGVIIATEEGGFAAEYQRFLNQQHK
jgi:SAM-dependent methyltransferase